MEDGGALLWLGCGLFQAGPSIDDIFVQISWMVVFGSREDCSSRTASATTARPSQGIPLCKGSQFLRNREMALQFLWTLLYVLYAKNLGLMQVHFQRVMYFAILVSLGMYSRMEDAPLHCNPAMLMISAESMKDEQCVSNYIFSKPIGELARMFFGIWSRVGMWLSPEAWHFFQATNDARASICCGLWCCSKENPREPRNTSPAPV